MIQIKHLLSAIGCSFIVSTLSIIGFTSSAHGISLASTLALPGESTDLFPFQGNSANINRLGYFSDLYYDRHNKVYYALGDRGPGGGVISYKTRLQKFTLDINPNTGAISNFKVLETILFTKDGENFNGLNPEKLNGNPGNLGLSFDPEGFAIAPNGNFYISDEYGPSVYEFKPDGSFVRAFATPQNLLPKEADGDLNFVDGRPTITNGRQDNRGFEGLTLSPDAKKLYALLQDPLVNEGSPDGRRSQNLRLVEFDTATGQNTAQYIYEVESLASINDRIPGTNDDFGPNSQGRNIGISAITALNEREFLVLERDNRGFGVEDPLGELPVSSKRVYKINLTDATDVSGISLAGTNTLPTGIKSVSKTLFLDIAESLKTAGQPIPEKFEGLAIGPQLSDGSYALLLGTDNDFSVTQNDSDVQFDVCTNGVQVAIDSDCPNDSSLIPAYLYSFKVSSSELGKFIPPQKVPEPTATVGLVLLGLSSTLLKRRK